MPLLPKNTLKTFFEIGDRPTQSQFGALIDSSLNLVEDRYLLGLKEHDPAVNYSVGDTVLYNGVIYQANLASIGAFVPSQWDKLNFAALNYAGTWNAFDNIPTLASGGGNQGDYYVVSVAGTTDLDGEDDWDVRDWVVNNGTTWEKVDNSDIVAQTAAMVSYDPSASGIIATDVQGAIDELETRLDTEETAVDTLENVKANKVALATDGNFAGLNVDGDLTDTGKKAADYLHKGNTDAFTPSLQYDPATKDYVDTTIGAITAANVAYVPTDLTATNVQDAIDELDLEKQDALGYTAVPDTREINGHDLTADITLDKTDIGLDNVVNLDTSNPANITEDSTHRFVTDTEKTTWNDKQDALGFTAVPDTREINGHDLTADITLDKTDIGLDNVVNLDTSNPSNITQDSTHRFVTDTEKTSWNDKQDALGFTAVPDTREINGHDLTADITLDKTDIGLDNVVNLDTSNPSNITQDSTHRFVTDTEKTTWNNKQNALGFTAVPDTREINGYDLTTDITLNKTDIGLGNVVNLDTSDPSNITQDSTHRFVTDTEKTTWNNKQNALGFTAVPDTRTVNGLALSADITLTKTNVGLSNVVNLDTSNPSNITEDSTHRFATDTEKSTWNAKQNALGFTAVPDTRTVNGHALTANVTVTKSDVGLGSVTDDQQTSLKAYHEDNSTAAIATSTSTTFATGYTVTTASLPAGDYLIEWYYEMANSSANGPVGSRVSVDGGSVFSASASSMASANLYGGMSGFKKLTLSAGTHTFLIEINRPATPGTVSFRFPRVKFIKV